MVAVIPPPEAAPDHLSYPLGRPQVAAKAPCLGSPRQQRRDLGPLLSAQARQAPRRGPALQGRDAALPSAFEPLTDCALAHSQRGGDVLLFPSPLLQLPGALPPRFAPIGLRGCSSCTHASYGTTASLLSAELSNPSKTPLASELASMGENV